MCFILYKIFNIVENTCSIGLMWISIERAIFSQTAGKKHNLLTRLFLFIVIISALNTIYMAIFSAQNALKLSCGIIFIDCNHVIYGIVHYCSCGDFTTFPMIPHAGSGSKRRKHAEVNKTFSYHIYTSNSIRIMAFESKVFGLRAGLKQNVVMKYQFIALA